MHISYRPLLLESKLDQNQTGFLRKALSVAGSRQLALLIFFCFSLALIPFTLGNFPAAQEIMTTIFTGLVALNLSCCTLLRVASLSRPTLAIHLGVLVTIAGSLLGSILGHVATINIHEGRDSSFAYRWDLEADTDLGFDLLINKIRVEYYPVAVKVGILKGNDKISLETLRTGDSFSLDNFRISVDRLDVAARSLELGVCTADGQALGRYHTGIDSGQLPGLPYTFILVAYQDPVVKKIWVDLELRRGDEILAKGPAAVNQPLEWNGLRFYNTKTGHDEYGAPYAGIQIVKDPGVPLVYAGFLIIVAGLLGHLARMVGKKSKGKRQK